MKLKIISKDNKTTVVDAETGEKIGLKVRSIKWEHKSVDDFPTAVLEVILIDAELEVDKERTEIVEKRP